MLKLQVRHSNGFVRCWRNMWTNVNIENFSSSWNDGLAFCALIHHHLPDAFDYATLDPANKKENFDLAFITAEQRLGVTPLLATEDMLLTDKPDWKCVFTYVQSLYHKLIAIEPK
ncbi:smoothelin-like protein 1 isoform X2 [Varroa jacobsoni]|uniref:Calponin-homology (CH) domain-containing protein n=1 Tax=Varroa destructor TaxID=109461 RepID=A0A7M7K2T6_VARDE|nr:smoothelin-like protein 1 isoform X2 [Varroa destructor]XP_022692334.1 smoothelin-like protein 1 isoform X2 [Varroa jacobsoni]